MRTDEEIQADCLRVTDVIAQLVEAAAASGDNPVIIQDEDGAEYKFVEIDNSTGDITIVLESP